MTGEIKEPPLSPKTISKLRVLLDTLPMALAIRLANALLEDRAAGGGGLPYTAIFDALRPRIGSELRACRIEACDPSVFPGGLRAFNDLARVRLADPDCDLGERRNIEVARANLVGMARRFIGFAPQEFRRSLPYRQLGAFGTTSAPLDLIADPGPEKYIRATRHARLLFGLEQFAAGHGLQSRQIRARREVSSLVAEFAHDLARELRSPRYCSIAQAHRAHAGDLFALSEDRGGGATPRISTA